MKRQSTKSKPVDPIANLISGDGNSNAEFPDGFVWFACIGRFFGSYVISGEKTATGKSYQVERTGTKVDVKDMESLLEIKETVWCPRDRKNYVISPVGVARI